MVLKEDFDTRSGAETVELSVFNDSETAYAARKLVIRRVVRGTHFSEPPLSATTSKERLEYSTRYNRLILALSYNYVDCPSRCCFLERLTFKNYLVLGRKRQPRVLTIVGSGGSRSILERSLGEYVLYV